MLIDLVDRGTIRILNLHFMGKGRDGTVVRLELADPPESGHDDLRVFEGASSATSSGQSPIATGRSGLDRVHALADRRRLAQIGSVACGLLLAACTQAAPSQSAGTGAGGTGAQVAPTVQAAGTAVASTVAVVRTQASGTVQSAGTQVSGSVQSAGTQVSGTLQSTGTQVAGAAQGAAATVAAAQTQIAPTAAAISTQVAGTVQPVVATSVSASPVQISQAQVSQTDTTIALHNSGARPVNIGGWTLLMGTFPFVLPTNSNMRIDPGQTLTLHLSRGDDTATDVYVGSAPGPLLNNLQNGATLVLVDLSGQPASIYHLQ
jgi:hypothetical protein